MATCTLTAGWLHLQSDLTQYVTFGLSTEKEQPEIVGSVGRYAGGRLRSVSRAGAKRNVAIAAVHVARATVDQIRSWAGTPLVFRDNFGRVIGCVYFKPTITELLDASGVANIDLTLEEVTWTAAV